MNHTFLPLSGQNSIDGILWNGFRWSETSISYAFPATAADYGTAATGFNRLNGIQMEAARIAFREVAGFTNLSFVETTAPGTLNLAEAAFIDADNDAMHTFETTVGTALGYAPSQTFVDNSTAGDVWFNTNAYRNPLVGSFQFTAGIIHEIGHALGLKHPHQAGDANAILFDTTLDPLSLDGLAYTVMSYRDFPGDALDGIPTPGNHPQSYMMLDIAALQYLYGANFTTNANNTVYRWTPDLTNGTNFFVNGNPHEPGVALVANYVYRTIWDGGGNDTYDFSAYTTNLRINLNPGQWTSLGTQHAGLEDFRAPPGNVANALLHFGDTRSLIENAFGGSGRDSIVGNVANNDLRGNAGRDTLDGGAGNDTLRGGLGRDTLIGGADDDLLLGGGLNDSMSGGAGNDTYVVDDFGDVVSETIFIPGPFGGVFDAGGNDTVETVLQQYTLAQDFLSRIENLTHTGFSTFRGTGNSLNNRITGGLSTDTLSGGGGNDTLDGQGGADTMSGGVGNDTYFVDNVNDRVDEEVLGSLGGFRFFFDAGSTNDSIVTTLSFYDLSNTWSFSRIGTPPQSAIFGTVENLRMEALSGISTGIGNNAANNIRGSLGVLFAPRYNFSGLGGNDTIQGGFNALGDTLNGGDGDDSLSGISGTDILNGGLGADTLNGGAGRDTASYSEAAATVVVDLSSGVGSGGEAAGDSYISIENVDGSIFADSITGDAAANRLRGNGGNDTITGGLGADTMNGGTGADLLIADNSDVVNGGTGNDTVNADDSTAGTGLFFTLAGKSVEFVNGNNGNDRIDATGVTAGITINGQNGNDTIIGGAGNDNIDGGNGRNTLIGGDGADSIVGGTLFDDMAGGSGNDTMRGGGGQTSMVGDDGDDVMIGSLDAANYIFGGTGNDSITGGNINDSLQETTGGNDTIRGGGGTDTLIDYVGINELYGEAGDDFVQDLSLDATLLDGGADNDFLYASQGNDTLRGGTGNDTMTGGADADRFDFGLGFGLDHILDFDDAGNDLILFATSVFADFAAVQSALSASLQDVIITLDAANTITLVGTTLDSVTSEDFVFV